MGNVVQVANKYFVFVDVVLHVPKQKMNHVEDLGVSLEHVPLDFIAEETTTGTKMEFVPKWNVRINIKPTIRNGTKVFLLVIIQHMKAAQQQHHIQIIRQTVPNPK